MPVDSRHKQHDSAAGRWEKIRIILSGQDAVRANGSRFVRRPEAMSHPEFSAYINAASFYGASARTLDGLAGALFRKPMEIVFPETHREALDNVDRKGTPFATLAQAATREVIAMGRYGVLVDAPSQGGDPFLVGYTAESIVNWRTAIVDGKPKLSMVVLRESVEAPKSDDPFEIETRARFRVLRMGVPDGGGPAVYIQDLWEKQRSAGGRENLVLIDGPIVPTRRGERLDFIPFTFLGPTDLGADVQGSPIEGLVDLNIGHFNGSAELEHALFFAAMPTLVIKGSFNNTDGDSDRVLIGPGAGLHLTKDSSVELLEFRGQGLGPLENRLQHIERLMITVGARMLEQPKAGVESEGAISLRHRSENSMLVGIANTVGRGLTNALDVLAWWSGAARGETSVKINTDLIASALAPQEVVALVAAWQSGGIGGEVLFHNLKAGERIPESWTFADWTRDIKQHGATSDFMELGSDDDFEAA